MIYPILQYDSEGHWKVMEYIAKYLPATTAVEIGVKNGLTTVPILSSVKEIGGHLWSFDISTCRKARRLVNRMGLQDWWTFVNGCSWENAKIVPDPIDFIFIDGDHYNVAKDWDAFEPKVRQGGLLLLHDYLSVFKEVGLLIDEVIRPQWKKWECCTLPYSYGLTIVRKL